MNNMGYFFSSYSINNKIRCYNMKRNLKNEIWKKLKFRGLAKNERYEISNYGRLKSFKRDPSGLILKNTVIKGYEVLVVRINKTKSTTKYIHKLVAEHFIPKFNELQKHVIHLDFNKRNNHVSNLIWVTRQTMFAHQKINPNYKRGCSFYNAKLNEDDVIRLKLKLLKKGDRKLYTIAEEFGITHTQLNRIRNGENWAHIKINN